MTTNKEWESLDRFLETHCSKIGTVAEDLVMKQIFPTIDGFWKVEKNALKSFIREEKEVARGEEQRKNSLWRIAIAHIPKDWRNSVIKTYEALLAPDEDSSLTEPNKK